MSDTREILEMIATLPEAEQRSVLAALREKFPIHAMEKTLMAPAETILEAIGRSTDLTVRGIEGVIAECSFGLEIIPTLEGMTSVPVVGNPAYDFELADGAGSVRVQVKMQRRRKRLPFMANEQYKARKWPADHFLVETQRTRTGKTKAKGQTRPYRFDSFDILAVSMGASRGRWSAFMYTVERWLLPAKDVSCLLTFQPIPPTPTDCWTDNFFECVEWFRSSIQKQIPG